VSLSTYVSVDDPTKGVWGVRLPHSLLNMGPSLIAVGFGSSSQLLSRGFSFRHDGGEGGRWKRE
jgi:hypothetical protein